MPTLIDTSLWIDFTRVRSPQIVKQFIAPFVLDPDAHIAEPVTFEVLRHSSAAEAAQIARRFQTLPTFATPPDVWTHATHLGQACRRKGFTVPSIDLLIAAIAIHHAAELITFDGDFQHVAAASGLQVNLLVRPTP
jgi:predicted nucleic acid-binding protein